MESVILSIFFLILDKNENNFKALATFIIFSETKKLYFSNSRTLLHVSLCAWFANLPQAVRAFPPNYWWRVGPTPFIMQLSPGEMIINVSPNQAYLPT